MITEKDLHEAIAECQGERNPNANTCIKLAAYYTILNEMRPKVGSMASGDATPSRDQVPVASAIYIQSESEFAQIVNGMDQERLMPLIDELMQTLQVVNPRLYDSVIRKLTE